MKPWHKTIWTLMGSFFAAQLGLAQQGLLWRIEGGGHTGYIYGTMHTSDSIANSMDSTVYNALFQCQTLLLEGDLGQIPDPSEMMRLMSIPTGELNQYYSPEEWREVSIFLESNLDAMGMLLHRKVKPVFVLFMLQQKEELERVSAQRETFVQEAMDMRFHQMAERHQMATIGLETWNEQMASASEMPIASQAALLLEASRGQHFNSVLSGQVIENYYDQDLNAMASQMDLSDALQMQFFDAILFQRNDRFVDRALPYFKTAPTFMAIGALHLAGPRGVLEQMRSHGFKVESVPFSFLKRPTNK